MMNAPPVPPIDAVYAKLGLRAKRNRLGPCPCCGAERVDRRPPIHYRGVTWQCSAGDCKAKGNTIGLIAAAQGTPRERLPPKGDDFRRAMAWVEEHLGQTTAPPPPPEPAARIPEDELLDAFRIGTAPQHHPIASNYLTRRKIDPAAAPARVLPETFSASWWPRIFSACWPLVLPAFDGRGRLAGIHGCAIERRRLVQEDGKHRLSGCHDGGFHEFDGKHCTACGARRGRKSTWPLGVGASEQLVFADRDAQKWLSGEASAPDRVLIVEGATDFMAAVAKQKHERIKDLAILGIESGSIPALQIMRWKVGGLVILATDPDPAGASYNTKIRAVLPGHVRTTNAWRAA